MRYGVDGTLDSSFDSDGWVATDLGPSTDRAYGVAIAPDEKIVAAGCAAGPTYNCAVARYNADGSLDATFDGDGKVMTHVTPTGTTGGWETAYDVAVDSQGRIVTAGWTSAYGSSGVDVALVRYLPNCALDTTFDVDGKVVTGVSTTHDYVYNIAIDAQDRPVIAGYTTSPVLSAGYDFLVMRYDESGTLDQSFDGDGIVTTDFIVRANDDGYTILVQPDGKVLVGGRSGAGAAVVRYDPNGTLDTSFGAGGAVLHPGNVTGAVRAFALDSDQRIVVLTGAHVVRLSANGDLDTSFGTDGVAKLDFE